MKRRDRPSPGSVIQNRLATLYPPIEAPEFVELLRAIDVAEDLRIRTTDTPDRN